VVEHPAEDKYFARLEEVFQEMIRRLHGEMAYRMVSGITGSQFFVLKKIQGKGRMTVTEVADALGVSLSAITALVDRLVKSGFVVRNRDEQDRRLVWLEATEKGREILMQCVEVRRNVAIKYFGRLPEEDIQKLIEIYEKVLTVMRKEEKDG